FFLGGGLVGIVFYRFWVTALTSFAGTLLLAYTGLALWGNLFHVDVAALAQQQPLVLNAACVGGTGLGMLVQLILDRNRARRIKAAAREREDEQRRRAQKAKGWWAAA